MKNSLKKYLLIGAGLFFVFACSKEIDNVDAQPEKDVYVYTFGIGSAEAPDVDTKSILQSDANGLYMAWESTDKLNSWAYSTVTNNYSYNNESSVNTSDNPVTFQITSYRALNKGDMVYCKFPYATGSGTSPEAVSMTIASSQTQNGTVFNTSSMPMVSLPFEMPTDVASQSNAKAGNVLFYNVGSIIEFDIFSPTGLYADETIESVQFTSANAIAGNFTMDLTAISESDLSTLDIDGYSVKGVTTNIEGALPVGSAKNKDNATKVYMVIAPGTYYGTIVLTTDVTKYTYTIAESNKITFDRSKIKKIGLNLESATCKRLDPHPVGAVFVPATSISAGDKIVIASGTNGTVCVFGEDRGNNRLGYSYTIDDGVIVSDSNIYPLTVGAGITQPSYYTLYDPDNDGYIAASSSSSNYLKTNASINEDAEWQIVLDSESKATTFVATGSSYTRKYLRHNSSNTPPLFSAYAEGKQDDVYIFKMSSSTVVAASDLDIAYTVTSVEIPYNVFNASGSTTVAFKTNPGYCASNLAINEGTKKVTFDITANTGVLRTVEVNITNNGVTKTVSVNQAAAPTQLVMGAITAVSSQDQIVFSWDEVANAEGYQISTDNGETYSSTQTATSYTWKSLSPSTSYTIYVKAIGDGVYYTNSTAVNKTATTLAPILSLPSGISWNKDTKTVSWTDTNTSAGEYGIDYKYVYTLDDGVSTNDATTSTTAVLSITEAATIKIKAVALTSEHRSTDFTSGTILSFTSKKYYIKVTSTSELAVNGEYLIVNGDHNGFSPYTSAGKPSATDLSEAYDSVNDRFDSSDTDVVSCKIVLKSPYTSGTNRFTILMSNSRYVKGQSGKTDFAASNATANAATFDWVFSFSSGACLINSQAQATRYVQWNGSAFGNYANTTTGNVYLYKLEN